MKSLLAAAGALLLTCACGGPESLDTDTTESALTQTGDVLDLSDFSVIPGASAKIKRKANRLDFKFKTNATPGDAYTVWICGFDTPSACASNPCSLAELLGGVGDSFCQWGGGKVAKANGKVKIKGRSDQTTQIILGDGLDNIDGAEIHLVLRGHGPDLGGEEGEAQLNSFNGGCPPNTCVDEQASIILAP